MIKLALLLIASMTASGAWASLCEVHGISDSPQNLICKFKDATIELRCDNGHYFLNTTPVSVAYHLEVEQGSVPLVFETSTMKLTVDMESENKVKAVLASEHDSKKGKCQLQQ